jgi:Bacterial SH3 domain
MTVIASLLSRLRLVTLLLAAMFMWHNPQLTRAQVLTDHTVIARPSLLVRNAPARNAQRVAAIRFGTRVQVIEFNQPRSWARIVTETGVTGWAQARFLRADQNVVVSVIPNAPPVAEPEPAAQSERIEIPVLELSPAIQPGRNSRSIFQRGRELGNQPMVFTFVGDSLSTDQPFLDGFGRNDHRLGPFAPLQATVDFFVSVPPRNGVPNAFVNPSRAATRAFNAAAALDASWTNWTDPDQLCLPNESPLQCEFRLTRPGTAIILLGPEDLQIYDVTAYNRYLGEVVRQTVEAGVIPVLTTFPTSPNIPMLAAGEQFNQVIRNTARQFGVPLIELRDYAMQLPGYGVKDDGFHLSDYGPAYGFDGDTAQVSGCALRNLFTLQMLDQLRRTVLTQ